MKANEYVRLVGWEYAKLNARSCSHQYYFHHNGYIEVCVSDLKRIVESHELVECYGGIAKSRIKVQGNRLSYKKTAILWEAIIDVESCK